MVNLLRQSIFFCLFAALFIPLIVSSSFYFPFITGKAFAFRILVEIATALWLILALRDPAVRPRRSWLLYILAFFVATTAVSTLLAENPFKSFWSNFERMEGYITVLHLGAFALVASSMMRTREAWYKYFATSLIANAAVLTYAFVQLFGGAEIHQGDLRVDASLGNAGYLAVYTLIHAFLATYLLLGNYFRTTSSKYLLGASVAANIIILYFTGTRGTLLGLLGGAIVSSIMILLTVKDHPQTRRVISVILALVLLLGTGLVALRDTVVVKDNQILSRYASIGLEHGTVRFMVWNMALQGFKEKPIFGWGQENFNYVFNKYYDPGMYGQEQWFDRAHNVFLDWLIAGGALALLTYLAFFIAVTLIFYKRRGEQPLQASVLVGLMVAYFIHNIFVFDNIASYLLFFSLIAYALFLSTEGQEAPSKMALPDPLVSALSVIIGIGLIFTLYGVNVRPMAYAANLIKAMTPTEQSPVSNINQFTKLASTTSIGTYEMREQLFQYGASVIGNRGVPDELKAEAGTLVVREMDRQLKETPNDARYHYFYGLFWQGIGNHDQAIPHLTRALELSPAKQTMMFALADSLQAKGKSTDALGLYKRAYELDSNFDQARINYAAALILNNQVEEADALLKEKFSTVYLDSGELLQAYVEQKMFDRVLTIWQQKVAAEPGNSQARLSLSAAYLFAGERNNAIAEIQKVMAVDPSFRSQGQYLISEIRAGRNPIGQ